MDYRRPELIEIGINSQDVKNMGGDTASSCNSSCCFTRESETW